MVKTYIPEERDLDALEEARKHIAALSEEVRQLREALEKLITAAEQYAKNGVGENEWLLENLVDALAQARKALEEGSDG